MKGILWYSFLLDIGCNHSREFRTSGHHGVRTPGTILPRGRQYNRWDECMCITTAICPNSGLNITNGAFEALWLPRSRSNLPPRLLEGIVTSPLPTIPNPGIAAILCRVFLFTSVSYLVASSWIMPRFFNPERVSLSRLRCFTFRLVFWSFVNVR